jgi:hypothetical protein
MVKITPINKKATFMLYDLNGKTIIKKENIPQDGMVKFSTPKGIYIIKVTFENNCMFEKIEIR